MMKWARTLYLIVAWLFVIGVLIQVFLAGVSLFATPSYWPTHVEFGYWLGLPLVVLLLLAFSARLPRATIGVTAGLIGLYIVQTSLPVLRANFPFVAALHPVLALGLFWLALVVSRRARDFVPKPLGNGTSV